MKRKSITFGVVGVLALSIGFTNVLAKGQAYIDGEDKYRVVTVEEQEVGENKNFEGRDLTSVISADEQNRVENLKDVLGKGKANVCEGDKIRVVTIEEQEVRENKDIGGRDITTVITVEEQNMVENLSALEGFIPQEKGTGFYFKKEK